MDELFLLLAELKKLSTVEELGVYYKAMDEKLRKDDQVIALFKEIKRRVLEE